MQLSNPSPSQKTQPGAPSQVAALEEESNYENELRRELREANWRHAASRPRGPVSNGSMQSERQYEGENSFEYCVELLIP